MKRRLEGARQASCRADGKGLTKQRFWHILPKRFVKSFARVPPMLALRDVSDAHGGYRTVSRLLDLPTPPTGVFCFNDKMAMGAYQAAAERGLRVPEDLSVVGYDDQELIASSLSPG